MVTKKQLEELGFSIRVKPTYSFYPTTSNGMVRRTAMMVLPSGNTLFIRGQQLFFIPSSSSIDDSPTALWRQRHLGLVRMSLSTLRNIVSDCKSGIWLKWEFIASTQTDMETNMWFGNIQP